MACRLQASIDNNSLKIKLAVQTTQGLVPVFSLFLCRQASYSQTKHTVRKLSTSRFQWRVVRKNPPATTLSKSNVQSLDPRAGDSLSSPSLPIGNTRSIKAHRWKALDKPFPTSYRLLRYLHYSPRCTQMCCLWPYKKGRVYSANTQGIFNPCTSPESSRRALPNEPSFVWIQPLQLPLHANVLFRAL